MGLTEYQGTREGDLLRAAIFQASKQPPDYPAAVGYLEALCALQQIPLKRMPIAFGYVEKYRMYERYYFETLKLACAKLAIKIENIRHALKQGAVTIEPRSKVQA